MTASCFAHLCTEAEIIGVDDSRNILVVVENLEVYKELASADVMVIGRAAQQKRIRKLLRLIERNTDGNVAAWEEVHRRWVPLINSFSKEEFANENAALLAKGKPLFNTKATLPRAQTR